MLSGTTKNLGVIGWPVAHSLSPAMQNAAIAKAGIDYIYTALPVEPSQLSQAITGLRAAGFVGCNLTIPHKIMVQPLCDEIDEDAQVIGAVNTVVFGEKIKGYNTDVVGFLAPLQRRGFKLADSQAVILGAGGAARAVVWGLIRSGVAQVTLAVRNTAKAAELVTEFSSRGNICAVEFGTEAYKAALGKTDLLVNTTPLGMAPKVDGMAPVDWEALKRSAFVYDIIYTPAETRLLQEAKEHGHAIQNGEAMLVGQGAASLRIWTGAEVDEDVMAKALRAALQK